MLVQPEIPANTGNIGRTCVVTGSRLHLVGPLGFSLDDRLLHRAGLGYWDSLDVTVYESWDDFLARTGLETSGRAPTKATASVRSETTCAEAGNGTIRDAYAGGYEPQASPQLHLLTKKAARTYAQATYRDGDFLVFGRESTGIPEDILAAHPTSCERIPMLPDATALIDNEAWRARETALRADMPTSSAAPGGPINVTVSTSPLRRQDICGNFIDLENYRISSLNLSNAAAIVLYEALRQTGFANMEEPADSRLDAHLAR